MIGILSVFAKLEREQIRERMAMGRTERAKSGLWQGGGWIPIGYDYVDGNLVPNPVRAAAVRDIYDLFLAGTPITSIKLIVNKKYALDLADTTVRSVLSHRLYIGDIVWMGNVYQGKHEPLVDMVTFSRAQKLLHSRARIAASKPDPFKPRTLLGGLLFCGGCGARYLAKGNYSGHGDHRTYRSYYTCYSRAKTNKHMVIDPACRNPSYAVTMLDQKIIEEIRHIASDPKEFDAIIAAGRPGAEQKRRKNAAETPRPKRPSCAGSMRLTPTPRACSISTSAAWPSTRLPIGWMHSTRKKQPCRTACKNSASRKKPPAMRKIGWSRNGLTRS